MEHFPAQIMALAILHIDYNFRHRLTWHRPQCKSRQIGSLFLDQIYSISNRIWTPVIDVIYWADKGVIECIVIKEGHFLLLDMLMSCHAFYIGKAQSLLKFLMRLLTANSFIFFTSSIFLVWFSLYHLIEFSQRVSIVLYGKHACTVLKKIY